MTITTEQRKQIREHLGTFPFVSPELADRMTECATDSKIDIPSEMLLGLFRFDETTEGTSYWWDVVDSFNAEEKALAAQAKQKELTQADVQTLLSIVRTELEFITSEKENDKDTAAAYWKDCDKTTTEGIFAFRWFSVFNSSHKRMKQREKTLVGLITKLKGLR